MLKIDYTKQVQYEYMYGHQASAAIKACPVGYLPMGCLERHGDHLPMGLDPMKAHGVCKIIAQTVGGIVFPPHYYAGTHNMTEEQLDHYTGEWGNIYTDSSCYECLLDVSRQLERAGIRLLFFYTGHYAESQREIVARLASYINSHFLKMKAANIEEWTYFNPADHAGRVETSFMLYLNRNLVNMTAIKPENYQDHLWSDISIPENASASLAEEAIEKMSDFCQEKIKEVFPQGSSFEKR